MSAVVLAQWCDLSTFLVAVHFLGIAGEANPVIRSLYDVSPLTVVGAKCLLIAGIALYRFPSRRELHAVAIAAGVLGSAVNTASALLV